MHRAAGGPANEPNLFFDTGVFILDTCVQSCWLVKSVVDGSVYQDVLHVVVESRVDGTPYMDVDDNMTVLEDMRRVKEDCHEYGGWK